MAKELWDFLRRKGIRCLWKVGPQPLRELMEKAAENPETMRLDLRGGSRFGILAGEKSGGKTRKIKK